MASKFVFIAAGAILAVGVPAMLLFNPFVERQAAQQQLNTSDAKASKGIVIIGCDNFIGYETAFNPYMTSRMRDDGYGLRCEGEKDNKGLDTVDYDQRFQKLRDGKIQFALATIDAYVQSGAKTGYPGTIIAVHDVSQGADAIVSCKAEIKNIDDLKRGGLKVTYVPGSPSEHLVRANAIDFDIPQLRGADKNWLVEASSSADAAKKCAAGVVDIAALWEPDVTKLLRSNPHTTKKLIGTENTSRLIVDVLIANRDYASRNPEGVKTLLRNYYLTLYNTRQNPDTAAAQAAQFVNASAAADSRITLDEAKTALKGVAWASLGENALLWFGTDAEPGQQPQYGLLETIESTLRILIGSGTLTKNPFPKEDANYIIQSGFIKELYQGGVAKETVDLKSGDTLGREFPELSEQGWSLLREVGTLQIRPVSFQSGSDNLSVDARENIDEIVKTIKRYPNFRILIEGHTGTRGDSAENRELSQERAETVARYLTGTYGVKDNRVRAVGHGGSQAAQVKKTLNELDKGYQARLSRVVVKLMLEAY